jgi:hypothetical protein
MVLPETEGVQYDRSTFFANSSRISFIFEASAAVSVT